MGKKIKERPKGKTSQRGPLKAVAWSMPSWMERYRAHIGNTGGNTVEDLMNNHTATVFENAPLALLCVSVKSQVELLERLFNLRFLSE
jgi:hypothetical protein